MCFVCLARESSFPQLQFVCAGLYVYVKVHVALYNLFCLGLYLFWPWLDSCTKKVSNTNSLFEQGLGSWFSLVDL
jgi:hypothetical protein